ncbi:hypothetical protein [Pseudomonas putida]|uniref:hypothetical protein n=2 Tax=Pseudomonadota TaxID=1224 RepID=UPI001CD59AA6|nr:hypothetical protein [Pseudomonas putida]
MPADSESVSCTDCGKKLDEKAGDRDRGACPQCGSMGRVIHLELSDNVDCPVTEWLDLKVKNENLPSKKKLRTHIQTGQQLSTRLGRYVDKERVLDKDNDRYMEIVTDPLTGEVLRHCEEALSVHQGHGSAKTKPSEPVNE